MSTETSTPAIEDDKTVLVEIENSYADGHESTVQVRVAPPADPDDEEEVDDWWNNTVFPLTGDGHSETMNSSYEAKVLEGPEALVDANYGWG